MGECFFSERSDHMKCNMQARSAGTAHQLCVGGLII